MLMQKKYVRITAKNVADARIVMISNYGDKWAFCYSEKEFEHQPKEYGLTELRHLTKAYLENTVSKNSTAFTELLEGLKASNSSLQFIWDLALDNPDQDNIREAAQSAIDRNNAIIAKANGK